MNLFLNCESICISEVLWCYQLIEALFKRIQFQIPFYIGNVHYIYRYYGIGIIFRLSSESSIGGKKFVFFFKILLRKSPAIVTKNLLDV